MDGFIAVHCGAGYHSDSLKKEYQKLCHLACRKACETLKANGSAVDAVEAAIIVLENSSMTNAGFGSNLTWDGNVECDASIMDGQTLHFGACGAVPNVYNPITLAKHLCQKQSEQLSLGRVPPCILAGHGAKKWAERMGLKIVDDKQMISTRALRNYKHCKRKLKRYSLQNESAYGPLDTVGAVCALASGALAAGASSGGVALKHAGRVGQAGSFGGGAWAQAGGAGGAGAAAATSGCGEQLLRCSLARRAAERLAAVGPAAPAAALHACLCEDFLGSAFVRATPPPQRLGGALALRLAADGAGDLLWGHSTASMCVAYASTADRPKCIISKLPDHVEVGSTAVVGGLPFTLPLMTPVVEWQLDTTV